MLIDFKWRGAVVCKCLAFFARPTRITKVKYIKINKKYKARRSVRLRMFETCAMNERRCDDDDSTGTHFSKVSKRGKTNKFPYLGFGGLLLCAAAAYICSLYK